MNKLVAVLIAGLFATSVYAQSPKPAAPAAAVAPTAAKSEAGAKAAEPKAKAKTHKTSAKSHNKTKVHAKAETAPVKTDVKAPATK